MFTIALSVFAMHYRGMADANWLRARFGKPPIGDPAASPVPSAWQELRGRQFYSLVVVMFVGAVSLDLIGSMIVGVVDIEPSWRGTAALLALAAAASSLVASIVLWRHFVRANEAE